MCIVKINDKTVRQAANLIIRGDLAVFPTETVYGLGGDAFNPSAIAKIFEVKNRPRFDPLIVHIAAIEALGRVADISLLDVTAREKMAILTKQFWPGPLTLVLPKLQTIPDIVSAGLPTVAIRIPAHETARQLITLSTGAIAAPSANPFGYLSPTRAEHVLEMLGKKAPIILDGGQTKVGVESTVLDLCSRQSRILRPGGISKEAIEALIGPVTFAESGNAEPAESPGMLKSHYAPHTPLVILNEDTMLVNVERSEKTVYLFFDGVSRDKWFSGKKPEKKAMKTEVLSETGNLNEAAARLFQVLHFLDRSGAARICAQLAPEKGLGIAINDRLRRASAIK